MSIKVNELSFSYTKKGPTILDNLSLDIKDKTINVILGLNGSGKTTLIKLLAGLVQPKHGTITFGKDNLNELSIVERSKMVSYVSQNIRGIEDVKVRDYLAYGMLNSIAFYKTPSASHEKKINQIADKLHINYLLDKTLGTISGGERQIVSIASSLLQDSKVILLDEPTSALDLKNQNIVLSILKKIVKQEQKTIILTTHNPNHALFLDANVILIDKGKIVDIGSAKSIITIDKLKKIYGKNIKLSKDLKYKEVSFI